MSLFNSFCRKINVTLGKISKLEKTVNLPHTWYGNDYRGFYVADNYLNSESIIYSFGVGEDISFYESLIEMFGCTVYAFDPTPTSIRWVENRKNPDNFHFSSFGIDDNSGIVEFFLPKNDQYVSILL